MKIEYNYNTNQDYYWYFCNQHKLKQTRKDFHAIKNQKLLASADCLSELICILKPKYQPGDYFIASISEFDFFEKNEDVFVFPFDSPKPFFKSFPAFPSIFKLLNEDTSRLNQKHPNCATIGQDCLI